MNDSTEAARREMLAAGQPAADLAAEKEQTWTTAELQRDFNVLAFAAPFVMVRRISDRKLGSLEFARGEDGERRYFDWRED
jgi:hypothetical protein